jgi:thiopeptide-type bacteriocin biosynthesis protein
MTQLLARYQHVSVALARISTDPGDLETPDGVDLDDGQVLARAGRDWLAKTWSRSDVREAITLASPALARGAGQVSAHGRPDTADVRRAVVAVSSYLLRWQRRATPFGMFASVTTALPGPATAGKDRVHLTADAEWLAEVAGQAAADRQLRERLMVVADNTAIVRDGRLVIASRGEPGTRVPGVPREVSVTATRPVREAMAAAARPVAFCELAGLLARRMPSASASQITGLLHSLTEQGFLLTSLHAAMTIPDGLAHLTDALRDAGHTPAHAELAVRLAGIRDQMRAHNETLDAGEAARLRAGLVTAMTALAPRCPPVVADVYRPGSIPLPDLVFQDAATAASLLIQLSARPYGPASWVEYQERFLDRYGPGAVVPVLDLLADSGLGYPPGYLGALRERPTWRTITDRDATLLGLIQRASLTRSDELELTDADIAALTVGDPADRSWPPRVELGFQLLAGAGQAISAGDYLMRICAAPRAHTSMLGRFLHLLDDPARAVLQASFGHDDPAVQCAQLSYPPCLPRNENVTRVPQVIPSVIALGEHHDGASISLEDLAVTCDSAHMYLLHRDTGQRVSARLVHALDTTVQSPPLARFLAEIDTARCAMYGPLDLGLARNLPHTPRIRYQRIILSPARWQLRASDLPGAGPAAAWASALDRWRATWRVPLAVMAVHGELRQPLDLARPLDQAILRTRLTRAGRLELHEAAADAWGWAGRPTEFVVPLLARPPSARQPPVLQPAAAPHHVGAGSLIRLQIPGNPARFDDIIRHLPRLAADLADLGVLRCWFTRYRSLARPEAGQHIDVYLRRARPDRPGAGECASTLARRLADAGLTAEVRLVPAVEQPGRYGSSSVLDAAEAAFTADSRAAVAQLDMAAHDASIGQALAAASIVRLAAGFAADTPAGYAELIRRVPHRPVIADHAAQDLTHRLAHPGLGTAHLAALPGGRGVAQAWRDREPALRAYAAALAAEREPGAVLRSLLHDHHARALGVEPSMELVTLRMARSAAQRLLATGAVR